MASKIETHLNGCDMVQSIIDRKKYKVKNIDPNRYQRYIESENHEIDVLQDALSSFIYLKDMNLFVPIQEGINHMEKNGAHGIFVSIPLRNNANPTKFGHLDLTQGGTYGK